MAASPTHTAAVGCPEIIRTPYKPHAMKPALERTAGAGCSVSAIRRLSVFVERKHAVDTDQFEVIGMGRGVAAKAVEICVERLSIAAGCVVGRLVIHSQMIAVLHIVAARVGWMRPERGTHDRVGRGNRRLPRIGADILVRNDLLDLHNHTVGRAIEEHVDPSGAPDTHNVALPVLRPPMQYPNLGP